MASGFGGIHSGALLRRPAAGRLPRTSARARSHGGRGQVGRPARRCPASLRPREAGGPVLFLHGFGGDRRPLGPLCRELPGVRRHRGRPARARGQRRHRLDVPEHLLSADLAELCRAPGRRRPGGIVVAGHSLGALVALRLATIAPHRVRGLILIASGFPFRVHPDLADQLARTGAPDAGFIAGCLKRPGENGTLGLLEDGFSRMRLPAASRRGSGVSTPASPAPGSSAPSACPLR